MRAACSAIRAGVVVEQLEAAVRAEGLGAGLDHVAAASHRLGDEPHAGAVVAAEEPSELATVTSRRASA